MAESSSSVEGQRDASACQSEVRRFTLTKEDRIRRSADYRKIMKRGARVRTPHFKIRMLKSPVGMTRLGIAAGKKAGKACARNRIKRGLREYFRLNRDKLPPATDVVFIALEGASKMDTKQLCAELDRFFDKGYRDTSDLPSEGSSGRTRS